MWAAEWTSVGGDCVILNCKSVSHQPIELKNRIWLNHVCLSHHLCHKWWGKAYLAESAAETVKKNSPASSVYTHSQISVWTGQIQCVRFLMHKCTPLILNLQVEVCDCQPGTKKGLSGLSHHTEMRRQEQMTPAVRDPTNVQTGSKVTRWALSSMPIKTLRYDNESIMQQDTCQS